MTSGGTTGSKKSGIERAQQGRHAVHWISGSLEWISLPLAPLLDWEGEILNHRRQNERTAPSFVPSSTNGKAQQPESSLKLLFSGRMSDGHNLNVSCQILGRMKTSNVLFHSKLCLHLCASSGRHQCSPSSF